MIFIFASNQAYGWKHAWVVLHNLAGKHYPLEYYFDLSSNKIFHPAFSNKRVLIYYFSEIFNEVNSYQLDMERKKLMLKSSNELFI